MQTKDRYKHGTSTIRNNSNNRFRKFYPFIVGILMGSGWLIFGILLLNYRGLDRFPQMPFSLSIILVILALFVSMMYCSKREISLFLVSLASGIIFLILLFTLYVLSVRSGDDTLGPLIAILWFALVPIATCLLWTGIIIVAIHRSRIFLLVSILPLLSIPFMSTESSYGHIILGIICIIVGIVVYLGRKKQLEPERS